MRVSRAAAILISAGVSLGVLLRVVAMLDKQTFEHDEAISFLAATGHQGDYASIGKDYPYGQWVNASEWKKYIEIESKFCFAEIGRDLALHDVHPPLYFWLLHLWLLLFGVHLWTGPSLNLLISMISFILLYRLAQTVFKDRLAASAVAVVWIASPAVIASSSQARQYDLLALFTIWLASIVIQHVNFPRRTGPRSYILMALAAAGGLLTHYHFVFPLAGCGLLLILRGSRRNRARLAAGLASLAAGLLLFLVLHPRFYLAFASIVSESGGRSMGDILPRLKTTAVTFITFFWKGAPLIYNFSPHIIYRIIYPVTIVTLIMVFAVLYFKRRGKMRNETSDMGDSASVIFFFLIWIAGLTIFSYIVLPEPRHAMGAKYLSPAWPFFAFLPLIGLRLIRYLKTSAIISLCAILGLFGILDTVSRDGYYRLKAQANALLSKAEKVLIDNPKRGILLSTVWHVPGGTPVFVADQRYLLNNIDSWKPGIGPAAAYVSVLMYGNSRAFQEAILDSLNGDYDEFYAPGPIDGNGKMFMIKR